MGSSMAKKDQKEIDLEILTSVSELNDCIKEVDGKINDLIMRVNSAKSDDKVKASKVRIGALKKTQEDVKQRLNDFIMKNCQPGNQGNLKMNNSFEDVRAKIEEFKKEEDHVEERLKELMVMIRFDKSDDLDKDPGVWTFVKGEEQYVDDAADGEKNCGQFLGTNLENMLVEDYLDNLMKKQDTMKSEAPGYNSSGQSSVDLKKITGFASADDLGVWTNIEGLELKMHELVLEGKDLLKKEKNDLKKSLIQWSNASSEEREALKAVKDRAVELATDLSVLLVDLVFIMSEREDLLEIFERFKFLLGTVFKDENFMVMNKIIALLEMTNGEMKELSKISKESEEVGLKNIEDIELDVSELRGGLVKETQIDELLIQILKAVLRLEYILMHPRLPHSKKSKEEDVKACLKQYEEDLKGVEMNINQLKESSSFIFGSEDMHRVEFLNGFVRFMVIEFWNKLGESFEEKEPRRD